MLQVWRLFFLHDELRLRSTEAEAPVVRREDATSRAVIHLDASLSERTGHCGRPKTDPVSRNQSVSSGDDITSSSVIVRSPTILQREAQRLLAQQIPKDSVEESPGPDGLSSTLRNCTTQLSPGFKTYTIIQVLKVDRTT